MLFILHVVMKTLDKTCCHVYIYPKCLYDNITTLGHNMNKEQAKQLLNSEIEAFKKSPDDFKRGYLLGMLNAFTHVGFIDDDLNDYYCDVIDMIG